MLRETRARRHGSRAARGAYFEYVSTQRSEPWRIAKRIAQQATLFALLLAWPLTAQAWTRSVVNSAGAELELLDSGELRVVLKIGLEVQGGWLSRFDVAGLEPDLQLDPSAGAWLVSRSDGRAYTPEITTPAPGQLTVAFSHRRDAPWRGDYELGIVYTARSPITQADRSLPQRLGIAWQMPAWDRGLEDVRVRIRAQGALEARSEPELAHVVRVRTLHDAGRELLELQRLQLPRATPWTLRFAVPAAGLALADQAPRTQSAVGAWQSEPWPLVLALVLAVLGLAKHTALGRAARQRNAVAVPLIPMSAWLRGAAIVGLCGAGGVLAARNLDLGLCAWAGALLLALSRAVRPLSARRGPATRPAPRAARLGAARLQRLEELFVGRAWLDLTTPVGALLAISLLGLGLALGALPHGSSLPPLGALLLLPLLLTGTRLHLPDGPAARLRALARLDRSLELPGSLHSSLLTDDGLCDPRLVIGPLPGADVSELAIVLHDVAWLGRVRSVPALRVRVPSGSRATATLQRALPSALCSETEQGVEWLQPTGTPAADLTSLLGWLSALGAAESAGRAAA
jgi:hypothetical protein